MRESNHDKKRVSTNGLETGLPSRRHFLTTMGKGAALASLGIFGAGSDAAVRGLFGRGLIPSAWGEGWTRSAPEAGYDRPLGEPF